VWNDQALKGVGFDVAPGEVIDIIARRGAAFKLLRYRSLGHP